MLLPIKCPCCGKSYWIETSINYEEYVYVGSEFELKRYVLKNQNIIRIWEDEELAYEIKEQFSRLVKSGERLDNALKIVSEIYGVPILALEELLSDLITEIKCRMISHSD